MTNWLQRPVVRPETWRQKAATVLVTGSVAVLMFGGLLWCAAWLQ